MKNLKKKVVAIAATTAIAMTSLTGCGSLDNSDVVATVGDSKITAGVANFYARFQQATVETVYGQLLGEDMWIQEVAEGTTYEDSVKEAVMDSLQQLYVLEDHMKDYDITITEEDKKAISEAAKKFDETNELKTKKLISADSEVVEEVLRLLTIQNKMAEAMTKDVDTEVSDDEAAQKSMQYVSFPYTTTLEDGTSVESTDSEKSAIKQVAATFLEGAKTAADFEAFTKEQGLEAQTASFDKETASLPTELITAADALAEGALTEVIETESGLYVAKLTSLLDREATDAKKEKIVDERKNEKFTEIYEKWIKDTKVKVDKEIWGKISFQDLGVKMKQEKTEEE